MFFAAGSIYTAAHLTEVSQLDGIGRRMPWTMGAFAIGALSMIGMPPTAGFLGKWFMLTGAMQTANWLAVGVIVVSTVLNAGYFLPIVFRAFFRAARRPHGAQPRRGAVADRARTDRDGGRHRAPVLLPEIPLALATADDWTVMQWTTTGSMRGRTIRRLWIVFAVVLAATVAAGSRGRARIPYFGLDGTFGFGAWFGFVSCVVLIVVRQGAWRHAEATGYLL